MIQIAKIINDVAKARINTIFCLLGCASHVFEYNEANRIPFNKISVLTNKQITKGTHIATPCETGFGIVFGLSVVGDDGVGDDGVGDDGSGAAGGIGTA